MRALALISSSSKKNELTEKFSIPGIYDLLTSKYTLQKKKTRFLDQFSLNCNLNFNFRGQPKFQMS